MSENNSLKFRYICECDVYVFVSRGKSHGDYIVEGETVIEDKDSDGYDETAMMLTQLKSDEGHSLQGVFIDDEWFEVVACSDETEWFFMPDEAF